MNGKKDQAKPSASGGKLKKSFDQVLWEYVKSLAIALILALGIKTSLVEAYKIPSGSMEDTLLVGDFLLANKFLYGSKIPLVNAHLPAIRDPKPGDVVIFKYPVDRKTNYIKRCIAVGGQTVEIRNKKVYVDGKEYPFPAHGKFTDTMIMPQAGGGAAPFNPYDPHNPLNRDNFGPYRVPEGMFFMMGDNRDNSFDSRFWGPVPRNLILGKAMVIHWSWRRDERAPVWSWTNPFSMAKAFGYNLVHFFQRVRWNRLGSLVR